MKVCGIIVEYNPLHNGHMYHIQKTKELSQCDLLIAVMSGDFVQRGEPALLNKHLRTKMALLAGVDVVVLLPYLYAVSNADLFAYGAIYLLNALHVDEIYFGSETNNKQVLKQIALKLETKAYDDHLKELLSQGLSYAKASSLALNMDLNSNDLLGIQYIRSILKINPKIQFHTIQRLHSNYKDFEFNHGTFASATSIREALFNNKCIKNYVPPFTNDILQYETLVFENDLFPYLKYQILNQLQSLRHIYDINEGIENKMIEEINNHTNINDFIQSLVSKRYTKSKIKRMLSHILVNVTKDQVKQIAFHNGPQFIQILGINQEKSSLFKEIKKECPLPVITNINRKYMELLKIDLRASSIYHLIDHKKERKIPLFKDGNRVY